MKLAAMLLAALVAQAETHTLTLEQAATRAASASPEALLARLDEQRAQYDAEAARDPYTPKVHAGSGLGYSYGFPLIAGGAPSVFDIRGSSTIYNRKLSLEVKQAREAARSVAIDGERRRQDVVFAAVEEFLEAERKARLAEMARRQIESARKLDEIVRARVAEGRELPVEARRTALEVAKAEQRVTAFESERDDAEASLAAVLGYAAGDRVRPAPGRSPSTTALPEAESDAVTQALVGNRELRRIESALAAKGLEAQAQRASRYPQFDLVAQYSQLARFNNYEDYFNRFQRHNAQLGLAMQIPLWLSPGAKALAAKADTEAARLRLELEQTRGRIALETGRRYRNYRAAETTRHVARLDLDLARERLSVHLARLEEGRASLQEVEELRLIEQEKWIAWFTAQSAVEHARFALLDRTGGLLAALR